MKTVLIMTRITRRHHDLCQINFMNTRPLPLHDIVLASSPGLLRGKAWGLAGDEASMVRAGLNILVACMEGLGTGGGRG